MARRVRLCALWDCRERIARTNLMCGAHWRMVPPELKEAVMATWHRFTSAASTENLKALDRAQQAATNAVQAELGREVGILFACTATDDAEVLAEARQLSHDQLLDLLGHRRRSGVSWRHLDARAGLKLLEDYDERYEEHRDFLRAHPGGCLIVATAWADREAVPEVGA